MISLGDYEYGTNFYESAMRVPLIISGKNIPKNIVEENLVCLITISSILSLSGNVFFTDSTLPNTPSDNKKRRKEILVSLQME